MKQNSMTSYFLCFLAIALFSTIEVSGKMLSPSINAYATTVYRFAIGALFLLPFALRNRPKNLHVSDYIKLSLPGILNVTVSMLLLQLAIVHGKASLAALLISCNPLFVAVFAPMILKERLDWAQITGLSVSMAGMLLIIFEEHGFDPQSGSFLAIIFAVAAAITFGLYTVLSRPLVKTYGNLYFNVVSFLAGAIMLALYALCIGKPLPIPTLTSDWLILLYLGMFVTGLAYWFFFEGQRGVPTLAASLMFFLKPVMAVIWAGLLLGEHITPWQGVGIAAVAIGVNIKPLTGLMRKS